MVFVSYNRGSLEVVKALAEDLVAAGHQPWFDQELTGGQRWWDSILTRIRECEIFVFSLTPDSLESQACGRELDYALLLGKPVLPVLLSDQVETAHLPAGVGQIQHVDYRRLDKQAAFALMRAIAGLPAPPPLPDPLPNPPPVPVSYVVSLREKIDTAEVLEYQDQIALVIELRDRFRDGRPAAEISELCNRLKRRDDLLAKAAREIDSVLEEIARGHAPAPPPEKPVKQPVAAAPRPEAPKPADAKSDRAECHLRLDDAAEECARLLRQVADGGGIWVFEIDSENKFTVALDTSDSASSITATGELRDKASGFRSKELKSLGWKIEERGFVKGAASLVGGAAVYATGGIAALALLSKSVRDFMMSFKATRSWKVKSGSGPLTGQAAEFALALQRVAPDVKTIILRPG